MSKITLQNGSILVIDDAAKTRELVRGMFDDKNHLYDRIRSNDQDSNEQ